MNIKKLRKILAIQYLIIVIQIIGHYTELLNVEVILFLFWVWLPMFILSIILWVKEIKNG